MNEIIAKIDGGDLVFLALAALVTFAFVVHRVCAAFEPADEVDEDEIAERIETAIRDATSDLLGVLEEIRDSNAYLEESERDYNQREGHVDEAPGASIHQLMEQFTSQRDAWTAPREYGRPRGFRPAETTPPYEPVDLRKPE
jgi:hypothetical protein